MYIHYRTEPVYCFKCGQEGHCANNCTNFPALNGQSEMRKQVDENANLDSSEKINEQMIKEAEVEHQNMKNYDDRHENEVDKRDKCTIHVRTSNMDPFEADGTGTIGEQIKTGTMLVPVPENNTGLNNAQNI